MNFLKSCKKVFYLLFLILGFLTVFYSGTSFAEENTSNNSNDTVYINVNVGNDSNNGLSPNTPVATVERAMAIAKDNKNIENIGVMGTANLGKGEKTIGFDDRSLTIYSFISPEPEFKYLEKGAPIFQLSSDSKVTFKNVTIDGKGYAGRLIDGSLTSGQLENFTAIIEAGTILKNSKQAGIAIAYGTLIMNGGEIVENHSESDGGGIYACSANVVINGGTIKNNSDKVAEFNYGGGISLLEDSTLTMNGGTIEGNEAGSCGGGIYVSNSSEKNSSVNIEGGTIKGNTAPYGGGIYLEGANVTVSIKGGTITGNTAQFGGGIYLEGVNITVSKGTISENKVSSAGGGIYVSNSSVSVEEGTITGNTAPYGGGIYSNAGNITVSKGTISENKASSTGGGICAYNRSTMNIDGGIITGNMAPYGGGIYTGLFTPTTISKVDINNNIASQYGGGIYIGDNSNIQLLDKNGNDSINISKNTAAYGGGISLGKQGSLNKSTLTMNGGTISENTASTNGGGIYIGYTSSTKESEQSVANITGGQIIGNKAAMNPESADKDKFGGGGIFVDGNEKYLGGVLLMKNAVITKNNSQKSGAGIGGCPTSELYIYAKNGSAIYSNTSSYNKNKEDDIFMYSSNLPEYNSEEKNNGKYFISPEMLDGTPYKWIGKYKSPVKNWKEVNGEGEGELPLNYLEGRIGTSSENKIGEMSLSLDTESSFKGDLDSGSYVVISDNKSGIYGGGIGSNGKVIIGEDTSHSFDVSKVWKNIKAGTELPEYLRVNVFRSPVKNGKADEENKTYVGFEIVTPEAWTTKINTLPEQISDQFVYSVNEKEVSGYKETVSGDYTKGFVITNEKELDKKEPSKKKPIKYGERISGKNRVETSKKVSEHLYPNGTKAVIIANKDKFSDVLTAVPFSVQIDAPILFTDKNELPKEVKEELKRLNPSIVYLNGGRKSISQNIEDYLIDKYKDVHRFDGKDRYETAILIGDKIRERGSKDTIELASGELFPDALSISSLAVKENAPILLSKYNDLTDYTKKSVKKWDIKKVTIAGQKSTISENIENQIKNGFEIDHTYFKGAKDVLRLGGKDRFETSAIIAKYALPNSRLGVYASGEIFADSLIAGPYAARYKAPVLLVNKNVIPKCIVKYTQDSKIKEIRVIGGTKTVEDSVFYKLIDIVKAK